MTPEILTNVPDTCKFNQNDDPIATISFDFNACGPSEVIIYEDYAAYQIKTYHAQSTNGVLSSIMNPITLQCRLRLVVRALTYF